MTNLTVIEGKFGQGREKEADIADNATVIATLEEWLVRARDRKVIAIAIAAVAADDHVLTQFAPAAPQTVFTLLGATHHVAARVHDLIAKN